MITGKFVSCYSCAGEASDLTHGSVGGERGRAGFWVDYVVWSKQSRSPGLEARVLYSLIIFQNYTAITFKIQSWGGFSGWDGGGLGFLGGGAGGWGWGCRVVRGAWRRDSGKAHLTDWVTSTINLTVTIILFKKFGKIKERVWCMLKWRIRCKQSQQVGLWISAVQNCHKLTGINHIFFTVWSVRPSQLAVIHSCATRDHCGIESVQSRLALVWPPTAADWSCHRGPPLSVKCFAVSATFGMNTVNLYCP